MKWIYIISGHQDGKTLKVYEPFSINETEITFIDGDKKIILGGEIFHTPNVSIHDTIDDLLKSLRRELIETIKWMRDDSCAPPKNSRIYEDKCIEALSNLSILYEEDFPEVFI
jgi:hypothetical protein